MTYRLDFIADDDLFHHVRETVQKYRFHMDLAKLNHNLIDPIKLTFDAGVYQKSFTNQALERILENEVLRQMDKSNTNHIGYFHQNIFRYIGKNDGWIVPNQGFDVENHQRKIFVEMKNKHNTMNSSSSAKTYMRMQNKILQNGENCCYLVEIIAKRSQNIAWTCSLDGESVQHERIRRVSIDQFYEVVTGQPNAFADLCAILPRVIGDVVAQEETVLIENTVLADLQKHGVHDILQNLYLLAFQKYQGFERFEWAK